MTNLIKFIVFLLISMASLFAIAALFDGQLFGLVAIVIITGSLYVFNYVQRKLLVTSAKTIKDDERAPVIYLRSFHQESIDNTFYGRLKDAYSGDFILGVSNPIRAQEQHNLAKYMNQIGPYTAIGRPGEKLPFPGARKVYVNDNEWQAVVSQWINKSKVVVLEPYGTGQGLSWEISHLAQHYRPERILIILPRNRSDYITVRDYLNRYLTKPLPEDIPRGMRLLTFKSNWEPLPISTLYPFFKQNGFGEPKDIDIYF